MRLPLALCLCLVLQALSAQNPNGCGYVSTTTKPPAAKDFYPAVIREVDGVKFSERSAGRIKLTVGVHQILVQERISDERRARALLSALGNPPPVSTKLLEVDVKADGNYLIGAQLFEERIDREQPGAYWEPVVWRKTLASCG